MPQRRRRKRHGTSTAPDSVIADAPNRVWAVGFQVEVTTDGRPVKIVSIVDEHTRECLGRMVERSITGEHLIGELDRVAGQRGTLPAVLRRDNGPELACSAMADWSAGQVGLHFIPPATAAGTPLGLRPNPTQRLGDVPFARLGWDSAVWIQGWLSQYLYRQGLPGVQRACQTD